MAGEKRKMRRPVDLTIAYRLIGSGPIVLVSSLLKGRAGLTPIAWHMPVSDDPPIVALEIWKDHFIHKAILETGSANSIIISKHKQSSLDTTNGYTYNNWRCSQSYY